MNRRKGESEKTKLDSDSNRTFFNFLESFIERLLILPLEVLAEEVEEALQGQRNGDDDGADGGDHPRRSELQRRPFSSAGHRPSLHSPDYQKSKRRKEKPRVSLWTESSVPSLQILVHIIYSRSSFNNY